jgi:alkyldihydroxyacetonephosphate synthase
MSSIMVRNTESDKIIGSCFEEVSSLIRNSKPRDEEKTYVTDSVRLKLYGFYKCSLDGVHSSLYARPSFFDPVGRAKYDAWVECESLCGGDRVVAMKKYLELASTFTQTDTGRRCRDLFDNALRQIGRIQSIPTTQTEKSDNTLEGKHAECQEVSTPANNNFNRVGKVSNSNCSTRSFLTPLIPRGQLDVTFMDLFFALFQCIKYSIYASFFSGGFTHCVLSYILPSSLVKFLGTLCCSLHPQQHSEWFERNIEEQWLEMELDKKETTNAKSRPHVVVGLSERSMFDLFLSVCSYPAESEIIIVPPVNIPGMMDVIKFHKLVMVPIDLASNADSDEKNNETNAVWRIDTAAIRKAITKETVAIFVVHPFGAVLGKSSMADLRTTANEKKLDIWEDCAQCYTGRSRSAEESESTNAGYTGSKFANASFFSFGPIKTATALGGGLAVLRSPSYNEELVNDGDKELELSRVLTLASAMRRIQRAKYKQQPNIGYLCRVAKCIAIHMVSHSRYLCATVKLVIESLGMDYNDFVVSSLRGFSPSTKHNNQVFQLRARPCPALLSFLLRRLRDCKSTARLVSEKIHQCSSFLELLKNEKSMQQKIIIPEGDSSMYGWLLPVLVERPRYVSKLLLEMGYDAPCGATQLKPVSDYFGVDDNVAKCKCPLTDAIFDRIIYLPVTSQKFTPNDQRNLIEALCTVLSSESNNMSTGDVSNTRERQTRHRELMNSIFVLLLGWLYSLSEVDLRLKQIGFLVSALLGFVLLLLLALCRYMGSFYLENSRAFSKHCDMIFHSPFHREATNGACEGSKFQSHPLMLLDQTRVPTVTCSASGNVGSEQRMALLSGATGFIGSLLLRNLLFHRKSLSLEGGVVLLVRSKKGVSSHERVNRLLSQSMFDFLSANDKQSLVTVIEGDVTLPNCGMESSQIMSIREMNISHVFHCAAAVSFSQPLEEAALSNITSSLQMQLLTKSLKNRDAKFVHISTAFVHGGETGTKDSPLPESLFSLHPYDPMEIYKSMLGTQSYASAAMKELKFPNSYTFSKCVCEHLLQQEQSVETIILRPSIVGPSAHEPSEGWAGERPSTIVAAVCLYLKFPYIMWSFGQETVPFIPVDVVCRYVLSQSFLQYYSDDAREGDEEKKEANLPSTITTKCSHCIKTVAWDVASPQSSSFSWISCAFATVHLGAVCGHVNRVIAYAGLLISTKIFPKLKLSLEGFQRIHSFVMTPINCILDLCDQLPLKVKSTNNMKSLSPLFNLPLLFFPFSNQNFHFKSDLVLPLDFDSERYMFSCVVAAHRFIHKYDKRINLYNDNLRKYANERQSGFHRSPCSLVIAGKKHTKPFSDFLWAFTQPKGNTFIRIGGWFLAKLFRMTTTEVEIDVASFVSLARKISSMNLPRPDSVILAPTHRSYYDFLIVSYVCFFLPELGIDIPHVAAASEFSNLPLLGWIAAGMNAFFVKRDEKKRDPNLKQKLSSIFNKKQKPLFLEVFVEGKRSRSRGFVEPKTGFLRCVAELGDSHLVLPITINYEALPDQDSLINEASATRRDSMSISKLLSWLYRVFCGKVKIGRVYITASDTLEMIAQESKKVDEISRSILSKQQERILVSGYHVQAASILLEVSENEVFDSLVHLNCSLWPPLERKRSNLPTELSQDLLWSCVMHFGHVFAPFLESTHKTWVSILFPAGCQNRFVTRNCKEVDTIVLKLANKFDDAEKLVENAVSTLWSKGFHAPTVDHIVQYASSSCDVPTLLIRIAAKIKVEKSSFNKASSTKVSSTNHDHSQQRVHPLFSSQPTTRLCQRSNGDDVESFGAWGFVDSRFILNTLTDGSKVVIMKGSRYSISGKPLPRLVGFIENELNITIDPTNHTFNGVEFGLPDGKFTAEDSAKILTAINNDTSRLSTIAHDRARHGTGHTQDDIYSLRSGSFRTRLPDAVVWPQSVSEVQALTSLATTYNWCIIPFGGGTNVTHSTHCPSSSVDPRLMVSVDMKLMNKVLWVNEEDGLAHVEAGITGRDLIAHMKLLGFTIGHEPDSYEFSTLGGWIATKASGMKQNKYGNIEDIVLEVSVVSAKGVISHKHKAKNLSFGRSSTGIEPKVLMLGSEGCLGVITSAVIKIWPLAEEISHESVLFSSFDAGIKFVREVSNKRILKPASVRLLDNEQFRLGQAMTGEQSILESFKSFFSKKLGFHLGNLSENSVACATITFEGSASDVQLQRKIICELSAACGGILAGSRVSKSGYDLTFAIAYLRDFAMNYNILGESFETFVPWSKLRNVVEKTKSTIHSEHRRRALPGIPFVCSRITQIYDEGACVYFYFCMAINFKGVLDPRDVFSEIESSARREILDNGGSLSHHHGIGKLRSSFIPDIYSDGYIESINAVKTALDPINVFGARNGVFATMN